MFDFLKGRKKNTPSFNPRLEIQKLAALSPPSTLVGLLQDNDHGEVQEIGKAFFLRRDKKLYSKNSALYLTTPDNLKIAKDQNLTCSIGGGITSEMLREWSHLAKLKIPVAYL